MAAGLKACPTANADASSCDDLPLQIGPYVVFDCVGRSDLGATYRCRLPGGREEAAVKLLHAGWVRDLSPRERIASEISAWAALGDVRAKSGEVLDVAGGSLAIVSRWAHGRALSAILGAGRRPALDEAVRIVADLIRVLAAADARGLVHGDLKFTNLIVDARGGLVVADGGVRRSIAQAAGTAARNLPPDRYDYTAPEIGLDAREPDAASDIYAVGCLLYHLVTGRPPFRGGDAQRKCAAHRAGHLIEPRRLGIEVEPSTRLLLEATLQADRSRRAASYNDLLGLLVPLRQRAARWPGRAFRLSGLGPSESGFVMRAASMSTGPLGTARRRWRTLLGVAAASVVLATLMAGTERLAPLLFVPPSPRTAPVGRASTPPASSLSDMGRLEARPTADDEVVTSIWSASDELRRAYDAAAPHGTITLQSPGPFLLDAIEIRKPITLRGGDGVRPLFLGGPGAALRVAADGVCLENLHFVRVASSVPGQTRHDSTALVEIDGDNNSIVACSWHVLDADGVPEKEPEKGTGPICAKHPPGRSGKLDLSPFPAPPFSGVAAIRWSRTSRRDATTSLLELKHATLSGVDAGVAPVGDGAMRLVFENCVYRGSGALVRSASSAGAAFESIELHFTRVTVGGAGLVRHQFPHPLDDALPLRIVAEHCLIVPNDRDQPILAVQYAAQPVMLIPKVSWSGLSTICPADATTLQVDRGPDASPWRAADVAAWNAYWGSHPTGLVGAPLDFGGASHDLSLPAGLPTHSAAVGADHTQLALPPRVALEQLPLLMKRL